MRSKVKNQIETDDSDTEEKNPEIMAKLLKNAKNIEIDNFAERGGF